MIVYFLVMNSKSCCKVICCYTTLSQNDLRSSRSYRFLHLNLLPTKIMADVFFLIKITENKKKAYTYGKLYHF